MNTSEMVRQIELVKRRAAKLHHRFKGNAEAASGDVE
jgi:hypothetical protein